ncbi:hypothetical protein C8R46DRAFT_1220348 [Mycena filopes]|nr:hypothetical protein C8R46DRAFT_1220348 [Mycena filopes]
MYSDIPVEVEEKFIQEVNYGDLVNYAHVCTQARDVVHGVLGWRCGKLLLPYFDRAEQDGLWLALNAGHGGLVGSAPVWITQFDPDWSPADLNAVVGAEGGRAVRRFLRGRGWAQNTLASRVPMARAARDTHFLLVHPNMAPYVDGTWKFTKTNTPSITLTETVDPSVFRHLAGARHTMATMLLTSTTIISLHPRHCVKKAVEWRNGWDFQSPEWAAATERVIKMGSSSPYGIDSQIAMSGVVRAPCGSQCPGLARRLRGGRGVGLFEWASTLPGGSMGGTLDLVAAQAYGGFKETTYVFAWTWRQCINEACETFLFPRKLPRAHLYPVLSTNPKLQAIRTKADVIRTCVPAFPAIYGGILFPTTCSTAEVVPVPIDHGLGDYMTLDDLRADIWIHARIPGIPKYPFFMPPGATVGGTYGPHQLAWSEYVGTDLELIVFMSCVHEIGPQNNVLSNMITGRRIHGDVLLMLAKSGRLLDLDEQMVHLVAQFFSSVWLRKKDGDGIGTYYLTRL